MKTESDIKRFFGTLRVRTQINPCGHDKLLLKVGFSVVAEHELRRDNDRFIDDLRVCREKMIENLEQALFELKQAAMDVP